MFSVPFLVGQIKIITWDCEHLDYSVLDQLTGDHNVLGSMFITDLDQSITATLKGVNQLFALSLGYEDNGNIQTATWKTTYHAPNTYEYEYDALNRLKSAAYVSGAGGGGLFSVSGIGYDALGNIESLTRQGVTNCPQEGNPVVAPIDELTYTYRPNSSRLESVTDAATHPELKLLGVKPHTGTYQHDSSGRMTYDPARDLDIAYNYLDLPRSITISDDKTIARTYDATGRKRLQVCGNKSIVYAAGLTFVKDKGKYILEAAATGDGHLAFDSGTKEVYTEYHHKDHLDNVRVAFTARNADGKIELLGDGSEVTQQNDFYPFGLRQEGDELIFHGENGTNRYLYNGKELNEELGLYDYGARWYDPAIGRWNAVDNSAENYVSQSPYHYSGNNPVLFVDYDGNDYGVSVNRKAGTITIHAKYLTSSANKSSFDNGPKSAWNNQNGKNVFVPGGKKALKRLLKSGGNANGLTINIDITSEVMDGRSDVRDQAVRNDQTGELNSFDTVPDDYLAEGEGGVTSGDKVDMRSGDEGSSTATHEVAHSLGIGHDDRGGTIRAGVGTGVTSSMIGETLQGVGIGGNTTDRNSQPGQEGVGTMRNGSSNTGLAQGKVMSQKKYDRLVRKYQKRNQ